MRAIVTALGAFALVAHTATPAGAQACQHTKLIGSDAAPFDQSGNAVAIDGNVAVVANVLDDDACAVVPPECNSGSAYVFEFIAGEWVEVQKLTASDAGKGRMFGFEVAVSGDHMLISAASDSANPNPPQFPTGAVYAFERTPSGWVETQKFGASDGTGDDKFGWTLAMDGDRAIIGAYQHDTPAINVGAVFFFERDASGWVEVAKFTSPSGATDTLYGWSVDIAGDWAIAGAPQDESTGVGVGAAYVFHRDAGGTWTEAAQLAPATPVFFTNYGESVAIDGSTAVVGADRYHFPSGFAGGAFVYELGAGVWTESQILQAGDAESEAQFGHTVDLEGDVLVVGARSSSFPGTIFSGSGAVYVFERGPGGFAEIDELTASDGADTAWMADDIELSGDRLIVSAERDSEGHELSGAAYVWSVSGAECPGLFAAPELVDLDGSQSQFLDVVAGPAHAGQLYWLLGSLSGTSPGLPIDGQLLPLNFDGYLLYTIQFPNLPPLVNSQGTLDANGRAELEIDVLEGLAPAFGGLTFEHAAAVLDPLAGGVVTFVSNPAPLTLVP